MRDLFLPEHLADNASMALSCIIGLSGMTLCSVAYVASYVLWDNCIPQQKNSGAHFGLEHAPEIC